MKLVSALERPCPHAIKKRSSCEFACDVALHVRPCVVVAIGAPEGYVAETVRRFNWLVILAFVAPACSSDATDVAEAKPGFETGTPAVGIGVDRWSWTTISLAA